MSRPARPERAAVARPATPVPPDLFPIASDARLGGDAGRTRLVFDLSRTIEIAAFTLADPYRVVIDLPQVTFQLPARTGEQGRGLIKAFRYGLVMQGGSRIVIDATGPVRIDKAFVLEFGRRAARAPGARSRGDRPCELHAHPRAGGKAAPRAGDQAGARSAKRPNDGRPLIVIDPGHGGPDTGTIASSGEMEKTIVLEFAQSALREAREEREVSRDHDAHRRPLRAARRTRAHGAQRRAPRCSSRSMRMRSPARGEADVRGATVYTVSDTASDDEAARLAEHENKADAIAGVDLSSEPEEVADILIDLTQRETKNFSAHFARAVVGELKNAAKLHKHPLKSAGFKVLKAPDVPSVLIELGYVSNKQDLKLMTSEAWRARTCDALTQAVNTYFSTRLAGSGPAPRGTQLSCGA